MSGQYFTTAPSLQEKVRSFVQNQPSLILEPSIGRGDLVSCFPGIKFDMFEIDESLTLLSSIPREEVKFQDFLTAKIPKLYQTIIGNPPYVKQGSTNLYLRFTEKCYNLLEDKGELIFIVPSDFLKLTSAAQLLNMMMENGTFTHIYHPHDEGLFPGASIDVIVYRYCKDLSLLKKVLYNGEVKFIVNSRGLISFSEQELHDVTPLGDYFDIYVGMVSALEKVFKHPTLGNLAVLNGKDKIEKYIFIERFPSGNDAIDKHLLTHKEALLSRAIRKFKEQNWFQWGAARNKERIEAVRGKPCIYVKTLTREKEVAFIGEAMPLGGGLLILIPKKECDLAKVAAYLNSEPFKQNFLFSGRFKIGQRQLVNSLVPKM